MSEVINVEEMMKILGGLSYDTACRKIREVKSYSDRLNIRGVIHRLDWQDYLNRFQKKDSNFNQLLSGRVEHKQLTTQPSVKE